MPSTFMNPATAYRLRPRPEPSASAANDPKDIDGAIPLRIWAQFQSAMLQALTPYKEPRERVLKAILDMEAKLGVGI